MRRWRDHWLRGTLAPGESNSKSFSPQSGNWAPPGQEVAENDPLWRQYLVLLDLYRLYLDIAWKATAGYYVGTGVALAYFFSNFRQSDPGPLPLILIFVAVGSFGFSFLMWRGGRYLRDIVDLFEYIALSLRLPGRPHVEFVSTFLIIDAALFATIGSACLILFIFLFPALRLSS